MLDVFCRKALFLGSIIFTIVGTSVLSGCSDSTTFTFFDDFRPPEETKQMSWEVAPLGKQGVSAVWSLSSSDDVIEQKVHFHAGAQCNKNLEMVSLPGSQNRHHLEEVGDKEFSYQIDLIDKDGNTTSSECSQAFKVVGPAEVRGLVDKCWGSDKNYPVESVIRENFDFVTADQICIQKPGDPNTQLCKPYSNEENLLDIPITGNTDGTHNFEIVHKFNTGSEFTFADVVQIDTSRPKDLSIDLDTVPGDLICSDTECNRKSITINWSAVTGNADACAGLHGRPYKVEYSKNGGPRQLITDSEADGFTSNISAPNWVVPFNKSDRVFLYLTVRSRFGYTTEKTLGPIQNGLFQRLEWIASPSGQGVLTVWDRSVIEIPETVEFQLYKGDNCQTADGGRVSNSNIQDTKLGHLLPQSTFNNGGSDNSAYTFRVFSKNSSNEERASACSPVFQVRGPSKFIVSNNETEGATVCRPTASINVRLERAANEEAIANVNQVCVKKVGTGGNGTCLNYTEGDNLLFSVPSGDSTGKTDIEVYAKYDIGNKFKALRTIHVDNSAPNITSFLIKNAANDQAIQTSDLVCQSGSAPGCISNLKIEWTAVPGSANGCAGLHPSAPFDVDWFFAGDVGNPKHLYPNTTGWASNSQTTWSVPFAADKQANIVLYARNRFGVTDQATSQLLNGKFKVLAGKPFSGDGEAAINAKVNNPRHVAIHESGGICYFDQNTRSIRCVESDVDVATGIISPGNMHVVAGKNQLLGANSPPNGTPLIEANIDNIYAMKFVGDYLYFADNSGRRLRRALVPFIDGKLKLASGGKFDLGNIEEIVNARGLKINCDKYQSKGCGGGVYANSIDLYIFDFIVGQDLNSASRFHNSIYLLATHIGAPSKSILRLDLDEPDPNLKLTLVAGNLEVVKNYSTVAEARDIWGKPESDYLRTGPETFVNVDNSFNFYGANSITRGPGESLLIGFSGGCCGTERSFHNVLFMKFQNGAVKDQAIALFNTEVKWIRSVEFLPAPSNKLVILKKHGSAGENLVWFATVTEDSVRGIAHEGFAPKYNENVYDISNAGMGVRLNTNGSISIFPPIYDLSLIPQFIYALGLNKQFEERDHAGSRSVASVDRNFNDNDNCDPTCDSGCAGNGKKPPVSAQDALLDRPSGLAVSKDGSVYILNSNSTEIAKLATDGTIDSYSKTCKESNDVFRGSIIYRPSEDPAKQGDLLFSYTMNAAFGVRRINLDAASVVEEPYPFFGASSFEFATADGESFQNPSNFRIGSIWNMAITKNNNLFISGKSHRAYAGVMTHRLHKFQPCPSPATANCATRNQDQSSAYHIAGEAGRDFEPVIPDVERNANEIPIGLLTQMGVDSQDNVYFLKGISNVGTFLYRIDKNKRVRQFMKVDHAISDMTIYEGNGKRELYAVTFRNIPAPNLPSQQIRKFELRKWDLDAADPAASMTLITDFGNSLLSWATQITLDSEGRIYITDLGNNTVIQVFN